MGSETFTVASFVATVGQIFTSAIGWVSTVATTVAGNPILLTFTAVSLVGLGIGLWNRLIRG